MTEPYIHTSTDLNTRTLAYTHNNDLHIHHQVWFKFPKLIF